MEDKIRSDKYFERITQLEDKIKLLDNFVRQENVVIKKRMDVIWKNIHEIMEELRVHRLTFDAHEEPIMLEKKKG